MSLNQKTFKGEKMNSTVQVTTPVPGSFIFVIPNNSHLGLTTRQENYTTISNILCVDLLAQGDRWRPALVGRPFLLEATGPV